MRKARPTDRHARASDRHLERITRSKRRSRSAREKAAIVAEAFAPGANIRSQHREDPATPWPALQLASAGQESTSQSGRRYPVRRETRSSLRAGADRRPSRQSSGVDHRGSTIANPTCACAHDRDRGAGRDGARSNRCRCRHAGDRAGNPAGPGVITIRPDLKVLVAAQPVDFRKGMDALAGLVAERLSENPYAGTIFVFRSKRADRVKILAFDGTGLILATKRLEEGRFTWPPIQGGVVRLTAAQFSMLVDGLDWTRVSPQPVRRPLRVG